LQEGGISKASRKANEQNTAGRFTLGKKSFKIRQYRKYEVFEKKVMSTGIYNYSKCVKDR
jgi:hypothetical protein